MAASNTARVEGESVWLARALRSRQMSKAASASCSLMLRPSLASTSQSAPKAAAYGSVSPASRFL